jgi:hypothetical protein
MASRRVIIILSFPGDGNGVAASGTRWRLGGSLSSPELIENISLSYPFQP